MSNHKKIVNISIRDKIAVGDGTKFVCDNEDYVLRFDFDKEWDGADAKTARLIYGSKFIDLPFTGNTVEIERTPVSNRYLIGVYTGDIKTSTPAIFECDYSILSSNPYHEPPKEDVYNQLMALLSEIADADFVRRMQDILYEEILQNSHRPFSQEIYDSLINRDRVYVEKTQKDGGGISPLFYLSSNVDAVFNPFGYSNLDALIKDLQWEQVNVIEGIHYQVVTDDNGNKSYHSRLIRVVASSPNGNVRTGTPIDSKDTVPYEHFKKHTFENASVKPYQVVLKGSNGTLYSQAVSSNASPNSFSVRDELGGLRGETFEKRPDGSPIDSKTLVNVTFLNTKLKTLEDALKSYIDEKLGT